MSDVLALGARRFFDRYNIANEADLQAAAQRMDRYFERERGSLAELHAQAKPRMTPN